MEKKNNIVFRIALIGPESTSKSTLSEALARFYKTQWVPEYARNYLEKLDQKYTLNDILQIAKVQLKLEHKAMNNSKRFLFIDTELIVSKVWCEDVFKTCPEWITENLEKHKYDLYLLCNIDLPWVKDELREYPDLVTREKLYHHYKDIMINQPVPWIDISGTYDERLQKAIKAVEALQQINM